MSIWHWIVVVIVVSLLATVIWAFARILKRVGRNPWLSVLAITPYANIVFLIWLALARWPAVEQD